jgi:hypothetical protein
MGELDERGGTMTQEQINKLCEAVYEGITGKCLADEPDYIQWDCGECGAMYFAYSLRRNGCHCGNKDLIEAITCPPLSTSLDAWREHIWPHMTKPQSDFYDTWLTSEVSRLWIFEATFLHHLEAAARAIGVYEEVMG